MGSARWADCSALRFLCVGVVPRLRKSIADSLLRTLVNAHDRRSNTLARTRCGVFSRLRGSSAVRALSYLARDGRAQSAPRGKLDRVSRRPDLDVPASPESLLPRRNARRRAQRSKRRWNDRSRVADRDILPGWRTSLQSRRRALTNWSFGSNIDRRFLLDDLGVAITKTWTAKQYWYGTVCRDVLLRRRRSNR